MRVLIVAPRLNGEGVGEVRKTFELIEALSPKVELTVVSYETGSGTPLGKQFSDGEIITFEVPWWAKRHSRLVSMLKPEVLSFNRRVSAWLVETGRRFDIAHQILPAGARYPTALCKFNIPYVIGSVGGSLSTPSPFRSEVNSERWFTRLRFLDRIRFRYDPWLRRSYANAELVLGVAPYMEDILVDLDIKHFEPFMRQGINALHPPQTRSATSGELKLLHVGRVVRTKGLRDGIRALAYLRDLPGVTLTSVGDGEDLEACRLEAKRLGVSDRIRFEGHQTRERVEDFYRESDALLFPSFRESMGGVIFEAMNWSLPIISVARGGPDWIVRKEFGLKVPVLTPEQLPVDLANAIRVLAENPEQRLSMGHAGREYLKSEALWDAKAERLVGFYEEVLRRTRTLSENSQN